MRNSSGCDNNKEILTQSIFYGVCFTMSILIPNLIEVAIGLNKVKSFCEQNPAICHSLVSANDDPTNRAGICYGLTIPFGALAGFLAAMVIVAVKCLLDCCKKSASCNNNVETEILASDQESNHCCSLFKKFKDNVLPTKFEIAELFINTIILVASCAYSGLFVSLTVGNPFTDSTVSTKQPVIDFRNDLSKTMMISNAIIGAATSLVVAIGVMAIATCIKYRANARQSQLLINHGYATYGTNDSNSDSEENNNPAAAAFEL